METANSLSAANNPFIDQAGVQEFKHKKPPAAPGRPDKLGQKEFLKLMVAQINNQDPFKPMKNGEFISQLAQFGTVDGVNRLHGAFSKLAGAMQSSRALNATALIGRHALVSGNQINLKKTGSAQAFINSAGQSDAADVTVKNSSGQTVRTFAVTLTKTGLNGFIWDGLDQRGQRAPAGQYSISASLRSGKKNADMPILVRNRIENVNINDMGNINLGLDSGQSVAFNTVKQVSA